MFKFLKKHENYKELIWVLATTDFKLRYNNSVLGYVWAVLKPLLMFTILNFVFSSVFNPRGTGANTYSLQLLVSLITFSFFSEGTSSGMSSLINKSQLVSKIYVPRWTIILASTLNATIVFFMNLIVVAGFFIWKRFLPSPLAIGMFIIFAVLLYVLILSFSLITSLLYVKFRDLLMIWEVFLMMIMYASPIIYPLNTLPQNVQKIILINPVAFIVHFNKEALINNHFPDLWQFLSFAVMIFIFFIFSLFMYKKLSFRVAEDL